MSNKNPCVKCGAILRTYWLKDGICNACRNPQGVVTAITTINKQTDKELVMRAYLDSLYEIAIPLDYLKITVKKAPGYPRHYYLYWIDGQIERRELYGIHNNKALLYQMDKRYHPSEKWIAEQ